MYHLFVEIQYFAQLKRVENEYISNLVKTIDTIAHETNARNMYAGHPFLYQFDTATKAVQMQAAQAAYSIFECLESGVNKLHGYRLLLDASDEQTAMNAFHKIKTQSTSSSAKNGLYLTHEAKKAFGEYFNAINTGDFWKVDDFRLTHQISNDLDQKFWLNPISKERIYSFFDALAEKNQVRFMIQGKTFAGTRENLSEAIRSYFGFEFPVLFFKGSLACRSTLKPIYTVLADIEQNDLDDTIGIKETVFRLSMKRIRRQAAIRVKCTPTETHLISAKVALRAGLEMRIEKCSRLGIPCVIQIEDAHELHERTVNLILEAVNGLSCPGGILISGNCLPSSQFKHLFSDFNFIDFPTLPVEVFNNYAGNAVPTVSTETEYLASLYAAFPENALARYSGLLLSLQKGKKTIPKHPIESILEGLPADLLEIFSIILFAYGMTSAEEIHAYLDQTGRKERVRQTAFSQLYQCGLIRSENTLEPTSLDLVPLVASALNGRDASVREACAAWMLELSSSPREIPSFDLMLLLDEYSSFHESEIVSRGIRELSISNDRNGMEAILNSESIKYGFPGIKEKECMIHSGLDAKYSLLYESESQIKMALETLESKARGSSGLCTAHFELYSAEWAWIKGTHKETVRLAKRSLLGFQGTTFAWNRSACNRLLGMAALAQDKIFDAIEYLSNARELAVSASDDFELLIDYRFEAIVFFMEGNLSKSIRIASKAIELAIRIDRSDIAAWLIFFKGRVFFEAGMYETARSCFLEIMCSDRCFPVEGAYVRAMIWIGRSFIYEGSFKTAETILNRYPSDQESTLFLWENALFSGVLERPSIEILEQILSITAPSVPRHPEMIDWSSGYSSIETCAFSGKPGTGIPNLAIAYLAYSKSIAGDWIEASRELFKLNRESGLSEFDPSIVLFHYLQFLSVQNEIDENSVDRATLLSKAFKHLQLRSSKIDEPSMKANYLMSSFWFKGLMNQAKKFKLI